MPTKPCAALRRVQSYRVPGFAMLGSPGLSGATAAI